MFEILNQSLGTHKVGRTVEIFFPYKNISSIKKMKPSCGCVQCFDDIKNSRVLLKFTPNPVPVHLKVPGITGRYSTSKTIEVIFVPEDMPSTQATVILSFNATITE